MNCNLITENELEQGSQEWISFRRSRIGASELPIIMGKSKWCTPRQLWKRKIGFVEKQSDNYAMSKGREYEPKIRELVCKTTKKDFFVATAVSNDNDTFIASLDGICDDYILEIKYAGKADHDTARNGSVPDHYYDQVQWQLFVTGYEKCIYASWNSGDLVMINVDANLEYIKDTLVPAAEEFYQCMVDMIEPALTESDYVQLHGNDAEQAAQDWIIANNDYNHAKSRMEIAKTRLVDCTDDSNAEGFGIKITRVSRDGNIDWNTLWKDLSENFPDAAAQYPPESYRREQMGYWKVTQNKE